MKTELLQNIETSKNVDEIIEVLRKKLLEKSLCKQSLEQVKFLLEDYESLHFSVSCLTQIIKNEDVNDTVFLKDILEQIKILFKQEDYYFRSRAVELLELLVVRHKKLLLKTKILLDDIKEELLLKTEILLDDIKEDYLLIQKIEISYKEVKTEIKEDKDIEEQKINRLYEELQLKVDILYKKYELKIKEDKDYLLIHIEFEKLYKEMCKDKDTLVRSNINLLHRAYAERSY
jgi:hypothetical protein